MSANRRLRKINDDINNDDVGLIGNLSNRLKGGVGAVSSGLGKVAGGVSEFARDPYNRSALGAGIMGFGQGLSTAPRGQGLGAGISLGAQGLASRMQQNTQLQQLGQLYGFDPQKYIGQNPKNIIERLNKERKFKLESAKEKRQAALSKGQLGEIEIKTKEREDLLPGKKVDQILEIQDKKFKLDQAILNAPDERTKLTLGNIKTELDNEEQRLLNEYLPREKAQGLEKGEVGIRKDEAEIRNIPFKNKLQKRELEIKQRALNIKERLSQQGFKLPAAQTTELADMKTAEDLLPNLLAEAQNLKDFVFTPGVAQAASFNPFDSRFQGFKQLIATTKQVVGKGLEGGVLRKEDEHKYDKILPKIGDTRETLQLKLDNLNSMLVQRRTNTMDSLDRAGYNVQGINNLFTQQIQPQVQQPIQQAQEQTATNPNTGQKMILRGGQWQPIN